MWSNWSKIKILEGIFDRLKDGGNWPDLAKDLPSYSTVFWYYKHWRTDDVLVKIMTALHKVNAISTSIEKNIFIKI